VRVRADTRRRGSSSVVGGPRAARVSASAQRRIGPRPSGIVTLLSDFGSSDPYVGIVKGVILGINPAARLVDLTHAIPPQDVVRGARALEGAYRFFPRGTVHLAVVDPGVGGPRRAVAVLADGHYFVGPDNGLLGFLSPATGPRAVRLANPAYHRTPTSRTFHARDIFGPVAAHCSLGVPLVRFGPPAARLVPVARPRPRRAGGTVSGEVLLADRFGNLLTNITPADLPGPPAGCLVELGGVRIDGIAATYAERPVGAVGAVVDSSDRLEVFVRDGSAQERLALGPGAEVRVWSRSPRRSRMSRPRSSRPSPTRSSSHRRPTSRSRPTSRWGSAPTSSARPPSPSSATPRGSRSRTSRRP
jgi:S-adenosylmethionine hydrolase